MTKSEGLYASEVLQSALQGDGYNEAYLKCFYANAHSMTREQEELEALTQSQSYDIIGISKTWWKESCDCCVPMDSYRLFKMGRRGGGDGGAGLYGACSWQ